MNPTEMPSALLFALRLTEVQRWNIVAMSRTQSVAEHSYRVLMIALSLYDCLQGEVPHNSDERARIASFAPVHDLFEILSGDLNSIFKRALQKDAPGTYDDVVANMASNRRDCAQLFKAVQAEERAARGTIIEAVVKIADLVEAASYIRTYGANPMLNHPIMSDILWHLYDYIQTKKVALPRYDWDRIDQFVQDVVYPKTSTYRAPPVFYWGEGNAVGSSAVQNAVPGMTGV